MDDWMKIGYAILGILMIFMIAPAIKPALQKSREAEEKHWGSVLALAAVLIGFIMLLVYSVRS